MRIRCSVGALLSIMHDPCASVCICLLIAGLFDGVIRGCFSKFSGVFIVGVVCVL